jgi:TATA-box binding protein (TBP) (component of TFIID and TFIIIB)
MGTTLFPGMVPAMTCMTSDARFREPTPRFLTTAFAMILMLRTYYARSDDKLPTTCRCERKSLKHCFDIKMLLPLPPRVSNVIAVTKLKDYQHQVHFPRCIKDDGESVTVFENYLSVRLASLTLVLFPSSGHVNITGIQSFNKLDDATALVSHVFGCKSLTLRVVSSTCSGIIHGVNPNEKYKFNSTAWVAVAEQYKDMYTVTIRRGLFASVIIRNIARNPSWSGCIQIFNTGRYNIVGCKEEEAIRNAIGSLTALLRALAEMAQSAGE